jgi:hypothetical protein
VWRIFPLATRLRLVVFCVGFHVLHRTAMAVEEAP